MRILPSGPRARLVEHADPVGYAAGVRAADLPGLVDAIPAERTVLVTFDRDVPEASLRAITPLPQAGDPGSVAEIPVAYDGEDLHAVAEAVGLTPAEVIAAHAGSAYRVAFCGFSPGFAYLRGLDPRLHVPRRDTPRARVPAGSLAIAAGYSAVYPLASPGGWHLLGRTDVTLFDPDRAHPALLTPGMGVRFVPVDQVAPRDDSLWPGGSAKPPLSGWRERPASPDGAVVEILDPGPFTLMQDLGRPGLGDIAVSDSGAFDRAAHRLANRIVGNPEAAATLEAIGGGLTVKALRHCVIAVTGAQGPLTVDGRPVDRRSPLPLSPGEVVRLGTPAAGLRSYLALRGGFATPPVLGSRAHDTLSGLGPGPLESGSTFAPLAEGVPILVDHVPAPPLPTAIALRLHPGPRHDRLTDEGRAALERGEYTVAQESNRIGVRLSGPAVVLTDADPLASEGVIRGSVQVPPDGQPVVLGPDHPVTGGYPVVGVVDGNDVDRLGQAPPGTPVRFTLVGW